MELESSIDETAKLIAEMLRADFATENDEFIFRPRSSSISSSSSSKKEQLTLKAETLVKAHQSLATMLETDETILTSDRTYEVLVKQENQERLPGISFWRDEESLIKRDVESKLTYKLGKPTDEYMVFLLHKLAQLAPIRRMFMTSARFWSRTRESEQREISALEVVKASTSRFMTLRIESDTKRPTSAFADCANSFFFQLSYNLDVAILPQRSLNEVAQIGRIQRLRRTSIEDIEAPKRSYTKDLVYHYQLAIASVSPSLQYLSFYHVAEHYFESAFMDDLLEKVRDRITQPDFSYRRKKDIKGVIDLVTKSQKLRNESVVFSEQEALRIVIEKYVKIEELVSKLRDYDPALIDFYRSHTVSFADADQVNLEHSDKAQIVSGLSKRIYKTRNAIVHSKEGDKAKYMPFEHDKLLVLEVPMLRFISESIILAYSKEMT